MTSLQWKYFVQFKKEFKAQVEKWNEMQEILFSLQRQAAEVSNVPFYPLETAVVYNSDLENISQEDDIKLFVIGDNPGKTEQLKEKNAYLVGQAGKIAENYFKKNEELKIDFRKNAIVLNKTPVHSAKTSNLRYMIKNGGQEVERLIEESQIWMAEKTANLFAELFFACDDECRRPKLWLVGYSELSAKGLFTKYKETLKKCCLERGKEVWDNVFVFQHFSMNCFTKDYARFVKENYNGGERTLNLMQELCAIGKKHKDDIFGF